MPRVRAGMSASGLPGVLRARPEDLAELEQRLPQGKETPVVVYCWSETCTASQQIAEQLSSLGYRYVAGERDWIEAGLSAATQQGSAPPALLEGRLREEHHGRPPPASGQRKTGVLLDRVPQLRADVAPGATVAADPEADLPAA